MHDDPFRRLYWKIFIQCPSTDSIIQPEPSDIQVAIFLWISWPEIQDQQHWLLFWANCYNKLCYWLHYLLECDPQSLNKFQRFHFTQQLCESISNGFSCSNVLFQWICIIFHTYFKWFGVSFESFNFSYIFVLEAATGTTIFFLLGVGVGFHPSLSSNDGGMILSSYSCTIYLTLFRGVGIGLILGLGTGLSGLTFFFKNSFINWVFLFCVDHILCGKKCPHCHTL